MEHKCPPPDIYGLEWKETTDTGNTCTFLGTTISTSQANLKIGIFDKALEWTFKVLHNPCAKSNAPAHQAAGVFTGQLTRFARACNNVRAFRTATQQLTLRMLQRGHHPSSLAKGWTSHIKGYQTRSPKLTGTTPPGSGK